MACEDPSPIKLDYASPPRVSNWRSWFRAMCVVLFVGAVSSIALPLLVPVRYTAMVLISGSLGSDDWSAFRVAAISQLGSANLISAALKDPTLAGTSLSVSGVQSTLVVDEYKATGLVRVRHTSADSLLSANIVSAVTNSYISQLPQGTAHIFSAKPVPTPEKSTVEAIGFVLGMIIGAILLRQFCPKWFSKDMVEARSTS